MASSSFFLTGLDPNNPTPMTAREFRTNQGPAGNVTRTRKILIVGNKLASVGSGSVDGRGRAVNMPWQITEGESEVVDVGGYHTEILAEYQKIRAVNKTSPIYYAVVPPGTGTATVDVTFATNSDVRTALQIDGLGETVEVGVEVGWTPTQVAAAAAAKINQQLGWMIGTCSNVAGVLTVPASMAGTRHEWSLNKIRFRWKKTNAMTITKGSVTPGTTDDDQTTLITNLAAFDFYYHVNPKNITVSATSTDNGIGEYAAAMVDWVSAVYNKQCELIYGHIGTASQAATTQTSINQFFSFCVRAENNDWPPSLIAARFAAVRALVELSSRAPNMSFYGIRGGSDVLDIPDPYDKADRPTATEVINDLNNGVSPINFTSEGKSFIVWHVTGRSLTNAIQDYRARPGHIPSAIYTFWESFDATARAQRQPNIANDPAEGQKRLQNFNYGGDYVAMLRQTVDVSIDGGDCILDPDSRDYMKASSSCQVLAAGVITDQDLRVVRHNLQQFHRFNETSPPVP